jgi:hypothetical protein
MFIYLFFDVVCLEKYGQLSNKQACRKLVEFSKGSLLLWVKDF